MRRVACVALLGLAAVACSSAVSESSAPPEGGTVIDLDGFKSKTPGNWKEEEPSNKMRFAQFRIPKSKGDQDDAELVIFKGLGGSAKANIDRWKDQFVPPEGKSIDDVAKVSKLTIGGKEAERLDIEGTYKFKARPFDPGVKEERKPGYKMVAVYWEGPKDVYQIKLTGPAKTVEDNLKAFDEWLKNFK